MPPAKKNERNFSTHLIAGGAAGFCEAITCHPLDTIKVRLQLRGMRVNSAVERIGFVKMGMRIAQKEGTLALYKGLGAVVSGIVPKMAIRFSSFEIFKGAFADPATGKTNMTGVFFAGLLAGTAEAIMVVTPMDVVKIRLQAQRHSMVDPMDIPKYRNAAHAAYTIVKEEGFSALYKGVTLTALRQATNQAVNFTAYQEMKSWLLKRQNRDELPSYQSLLLGGISGAMGPLSNAPLDTIKTRIQKMSKNELTGNGWQRFLHVVNHIIQKEGYMAFYKGLTPRILRVAPGQAVTFMVYEKVRRWLERLKSPEELTLGVVGIGRKV